MLKFFLVPVAICLLAPALPGRLAHAHGVRIFAWPDGERVCSESAFSKKNKVRGGAVSARDDAGNLLAEGRTDNEGLWCFPAPSPRNLTLTVNAGEGHRAEFVLPAKALGEAASQPVASLPPECVEPTLPSSAAGLSAVSPNTLPGVLPAGLDQSGFSALLREAVRTELQAQLAPIRRILAEREADPGHDWRGILGGLGWIVGLAGLAAWGVSRRKA